MPRGDDLVQSKLNKLVALRALSVDPDMCSFKNRHGIRTSIGGTVILLVLKKPAPTPCHMPGAS
jgi:hypothetical protein